MIKWFLLTNDDSSGPFSTEQIKSLDKNNLIDPGSLIWSRLQGHWLSLDQWFNNIDNIVSLSKKIKTQLWHYSLNNKKHGPFPREELINELVGNKNKLKNILLWTKGMKNWNPLFDFLDIINDLGINARQFPRTSIDGEFIISSEIPLNTFPLSTISENGMGILNAQSLIVGKEIFGDIVSDILPNKMRITAEVRYIGEYGFAGLMFRQINMEAKQTIIDYIKSKPISISNEIEKKAS